MSSSYDKWFALWVLSAIMACSDEEQRYLSTAYVCFLFLFCHYFVFLPICWVRFPSHRSDAERRLRGDRGQLACHCHLEFFPLCVVLPPFPIPVFTTRGAQDRIRRPPHLLPLCDFRSALRLTSVDYWAECEFHSFWCCCCCFSQSWLRLMTVRCVLSQISNSIKESLEHEVVHYDYKSSFFDIFVSVWTFRFNVDWQCCVGMQSFLTTQETASTIVVLLPVSHTTSWSCFITDLVVSACEFHSVCFAPARSESQYHIMKTLTVKSLFIWTNLSRVTCLHSWRQSRGHFEKLSVPVCLSSWVCFVSCVFNWATLLFVWSIGGLLR